MAVWFGLLLAVLGLVMFTAGVWLEQGWLEFVGQLLTMTSYYFLGRAHGHSKAVKEEKEMREVAHKKLQLKSKLYEEVYGHR